MIRARVSEFEARQFAGESQRSFAEEMTADGFPISYADFRKLYSRARKQVKRMRPASTGSSLTEVKSTLDISGKKELGGDLTRCAGYVHQDTASYDEDELI